MTPRERLIQEIGQVPDTLVEEVLDFLLFLKQKQNPEVFTSNQVDSTVDSPMASTVLERMGGLPKHLLSVGNLSDRDNRRTLLASRIKQRHQNQR